MPGLAALAAHPDVEPTISMASEAALGTAAQSDHQEVLVIECPPGELVGAVRAHERHRLSGIVVIQGLMVDPSARGRGIGAEAVRALARRVLGDHGRHRLEAEVYAFNEPGLRAFDAAGFEREGRRRRAYWRHGAWQDSVLFARVAEGDEPPR